MYEDRIIGTDYSEEMKKSFIDYAMSVIVDRAIPDVKDGLKPVQRRILYSMYKQGFTPDKPYRKCATTVGDVLGKYHPHGDASVYDAMVRLSQDWLLTLPLVDGHGNFGSIDGDSPAAMRYTESRLNTPAIDMLGDLEKEVVDFRPNFDNSQKEPVVLPAKIPNLLINGSSGIAVGMATNIPPHNPAEVIKAVISYINNPDITISRLMRDIKGPDFPTGGIICNPKDLKKIYETGTSSSTNGGKSSNIRIRAKIEIEPASYGKTNLVVTEIPYTLSGNKIKIINKLIDMVKDGSLSELSDVRDESSMEGIRIVLEVKKGVDIDNLLNKLYKKTPLEDTMHVNFLALVDGRPQVLNLKEMIAHYVEFQKEINIRKYKYLLPRAEERKEVLEGLIKAYDLIDLIIEIIRGSKDVKTAKECLISGNTEGISFKTKKSEKEAKKLNFTERQATAILTMQLQRLVGLEINKVQEELDEINKEIKRYNDILNDEKILMQVIKDYLTELRKTYNQKRKTEIKELSVAEYKEEFKEEDLVILIDRFGYVKTVDIASYNRSNEETINEFRYVQTTKNTDKLCVFTKEGNLHQIKLTDIPKGKIKDRGVPLDTYSKIGEENIVLVDVFSNIKDNKIIFVTKKGLIKSTDGNEFETIRTQINATKLDKDDEVLEVKIINEINDNAEESDNTEINNVPTHVVLVSNKGYALKFEISTIPEFKKTSKGVKGMALSKEDYLTKVVFLYNDKNEILKINGKEINLSRMHTKKRNQVGVRL